MFEILCTLSDELGTRTVPTGHAYHRAEVAQVKLESLQSSYPSNRFWVEFVPSEDAWNGY